MSEILSFFSEHYFLAFCAICTAWSVMASALYTVRRLARCVMVLCRGWPPAHRDADCDWPSVAQAEV